MLLLLFSVNYRPSRKGTVLSYLLFGTVSSHKPYTKVSLAFSLIFEVTFINLHDNIVKTSLGILILE